MITTAATALFARAGFIDDHIAAVIFLPVKLGDSCIGSLIIGHFDESKAARTASLTIIDDVGRFYRTGRSKMFLQILTCHAKRQVSNIKFITHFPLYFYCPEKRKRRAKSEKYPTKAATLPNQKFQKLPLSLKPNSPKPNRKSVALTNRTDCICQRHLREQNLSKYAFF